MYARVCRDVHGPEFVDLEASTLETNAFLLEEQGTGRDEFGYYGHEQGANAQHGQGDQTTGISTVRFQNGM